MVYDLIFVISLSIFGFPSIISLNGVCPLIKNVDSILVDVFLTNYNTKDKEKITRML